MNSGGDAAEQVVRMTLEGVEVAARITGTGAKNVAILLAATLKEEQKTHGKSRLTSMIKSGKPLQVYTIQSKDLKKFSEEAKRYGVLYCVLKDRNNKSENAPVDVMVRTEDAAKIQRITDRFNLATVDSAKVMSQIQKDRAFPEKGVQTKDAAVVEKEREAMKASGKEEHAVNPSQAKTEKSPLSEPDSKQESRSNGSETGMKTNPSVKEKLDAYKEQARREHAAKQRERAAGITSEKTGEAISKIPLPKEKPKVR